MHRLIRIILNIILLATLVACASTPVEPPPDLKWPMPPEKTRIKFHDYLMGSLDVTRGRQNKFSQAMFGEGGEVTFGKPSYVAVKGGRIYITDIGAIHYYDFKRRRFSTFGKGLLRNPTGIDVANDGSIYVADSSLRKIIIFRKSGQKIISDNKRFGGMGGLALDEKRGRFFVANTKKHNILVFDLDGEYLFTFGQRGVADGTFNYPYDIDVDDKGRIYVLDSGNFRVQIFDSEGRFLSKFGEVGAGPGFFARPKGVTVSSDGLIFVVDAAFANIQIFDDRGRPYLSFGQGGQSPGMFLLPMGITIDKDGLVYIVDQMNKRVQIFKYITYKDEPADRRSKLVPMDTTPVFPSTERLPDVVK